MRHSMPLAITRGLHSSTARDIASQSGSVWPVNVAVGQDKHCVQSIHPGLLILQGHWLIYGGSCEYKNRPGEVLNQLHMFDFASESWIDPRIKYSSSCKANYGTSLNCRRGHMAVCYNDAMLVLGGENQCSQTLIFVYTWSTHSSLWSMRVHITLFSC